MENLRIYAATFNVAATSPEQPLTELLSITSDAKEKLPDFYVLSFQEVNAQPQNMLMDSLFEDPWTTECRRVLKAKGYIKLKSIRLQGILTIVFSLRRHLLSIREIESDYTRTGLKGMWGNKGAVSIRLSIYGCSICFVNSHLSAHDHQLKDRVEDYNSIINDQEFHVDETSRIFFHDYVFWMGDLNFRLREELDKTPEEIEQQVLNKDLKTLFEHDQLRYVMRNGEAFSELIEQDPDFCPTFKYEVGTSDYNHKRRPAWCDRILYKVNQNNYENVTLKVNQLSYKSYPSYTQSDHKPVSAEFEIKIPKENISLRADSQVFSDFSECVIEFDQIVSWTEDEDNKAFYKRVMDVPPTKEDWIGLFRENFDSLDDYVTYEYVSKCATPVNGEKSITLGTGAPVKFEVTFSELPNHCKGKYCLVYFSQTDDKVSSVLGISNSFPVVKNSSD